MALVDSSLRILIIDDKVNMRRTIKNLLKKCGYRNFHEADDGDKAMIKLEFEPIDFILCDWNMPRMNGGEVLKAVRGNSVLKKTPFLMITAEMDEGQVATAIEDGVDDYILKPFTPGLLQEKMEKILKAKAAPSPIEINLNLGHAYFKSHRFKEALTEYKKALKINAESPRVSLAMAQVFEATGDIGRAEKLLNRAIRLSPKFVKAHEALSVVLASRGDAEGALKHLEEAVAIAPKNIERQMKLGKALIEGGNEKQAKISFMAVMDIAKENQSEMARQIGEIYLEAGLEAEAQDIFLEGLAADPTDLHLHNRLGIAYRKQKKYKEAVANYEKALKIDPENENLHYNLGRAHHEAGDIDKAASAMRVALRLYPEFEEARDFLTKALRK